MDTIMFLAYLWKTFRLVATLAVAILFVRTLVIEPGRVNGVSMEPTFLDDEIFFLNKFKLIFSPPKRGQIIQAHRRDSDKLLIKRVIGVPGDIVEIRENSVFITGPDGIQVRVHEPYLPEGTVTLMSDKKPRAFPVLGPNEYFVLGDNRKFSGDSREYGPINRDEIVGSVMTSR